VPAAIFMARYCSLLRAESARGLPPVETLERVNVLLTQRNEPGMFVTSIYGILDPDSSTFQYARAGHEIPLLFDSTGYQIQVGHGLGQPLGIFEDAVIDPGEIKLEPGMTLFFNSDGASDATNPSGAYFGVPRLIEIITTHLDQPAQTMCESLLAALNSYRQDSAQFDDITLVAIKTER
jgi:sigma-B regulation protein RsbU (phosphoserine phosphatase)